MCQNWTGIDPMLVASGRYRPGSGTLLSFIALIWRSHQWDSNRRVADLPTIHEHSLFIGCCTICMLCNINYVIPIQCGFRINVVDGLSLGTRNILESSVCNHHYIMMHAGQLNSGSVPVTNLLYRKLSNIRRTKSQHLNDSRLILQMSLPNPLKPGVKLRMKV